MKNKMNVLVSLKKVNGVIRSFDVLEYSNSKERLEYLMTCKKCEELKEKGLELRIFSQLH